MTAKRPQVKVEPRIEQRGWAAVCYEDGCGWTYPERLVAIKTDAEQQARWHRDQHRRSA
jgi:hypothetical protein